MKNNPNWRNWNKKRNSFNMRREPTKTRWEKS